MKKTLRRIFVARPKNPGPDDTPAPGGRCHSSARGRTWTGHSPVPEDQDAGTWRTAAAAAPPSPASRAACFAAAERSLQARLPQARVVDAGRFPGRMDLLDGVRAADTRLLVAMDPEDSSRYAAVSLVIHAEGAQEEEEEEAAAGAGPRPIVVAQDALAHLLRQWHRGGAEPDGSLALVARGAESSAHVFRAADGALVDLPPAAAAEGGPGTRGDPVVPGPWDLRPAAGHVDACSAFAPEQHGVLDSCLGRGASSAMAV